MFVDVIPLLKDQTKIREPFLNPWLNCDCKFCYQEAIPALWMYTLLKSALAKLPGGTFVGLCSQLEYISANTYTLQTLKYWCLARSPIAASDSVESITELGVARNKAHPTLQPEYQSNLL